MSVLIVNVEQQPLTAEELQYFLQYVFAGFGVNTDIR